MTGNMRRITARKPSTSSTGSRKPRRGREVSGEERREQILMTARELFYRQGYRQTSQNDIARSLGITGPALYYYFNNKEDILFEIRDQIVRESLDRVRAIVQADGAPADKLRQILRAHVLTLIDNAAPNVVFDRERGHLSGNREKVIREHEREYEDLLRTLYADGVRDGSFRDVHPTIAVGSLLAACNWIHHFNAADHGLDADSIADIVGGLLEQGYRR